MNACVIRNTSEYKDLKEKSGVSDTMLTVRCEGFRRKYGRFPHLDELPGADSTKHFRETLKINENGGSKIDHILERASASSIEEANVKLNDEYRDLDITLLPIHDEAVVEVQRRPRRDIINDGKVDVDSNPDTYQVMETAIDKISNRYGIKVNAVNTKEIKTLTEIPNAGLTKGFIYNGQIYINLDNYTPDTMIHEMMHLLIGGMRFSLPDMY